MKIVTGVGEKDHVTPEEHRRLYESIIGSGSRILPCGEKMDPNLVSNNLFRIRSGEMIHHGNVSSVKNYDEVELTNGTQGMMRIDLVVNRYTKNAETEIESNEWHVILGTPAEADPVCPEHIVGDLRKGDLVDDCPVYEIHYDGLNVSEVKQLLPVAKSIEELEKENAKLNSNCIGFPDYANVLATYSNVGFTAPENCWAVFELTSGWTNVTVSINKGGILFQQIKNTDSYPIRTSTMVPLKKGDIVEMSSATSINGITARLYPMRILQAVYDQVENGNEVEY